MSLEAGIYARLSGYANLVSLVSLRIYPEVLPQDCPFPAVSYHKVSETPEHAMSSEAGVRSSRVQVSSFAETYVGVKAVLTQVKAALSRYRGTMGSTVFQNILLDGTWDIYEPDTGIYHCPADFIVWYEE